MGRENAPIERAATAPGQTAGEFCRRIAAATDGVCILAILGPSKLAGELDLNCPSRCSRALATLLAGGVLALLGACTGYGKPDTPSTDLAFGVDMARRGLWNEAMFRFEAAARAEPDNGHVQSNLGVAYEAQGNFDKALEQYKKALQLAPDDKGIRANYARFVEFYQAFKNPNSKTAKSKGTPGSGKGKSTGVPGSAGSPAATPPSSSPPSSSPPASPSSASPDPQPPPTPVGTGEHQAPGTPPPAPTSPPPPAAPSV
jgi:hypothetical protein